MSALENHLKGMGMDLQLAKTITALEESERLMKQGRIRPEAYDAMLKEVLNGLSKAEKSASKQNKKKYKQIQALFSGLGKSQKSVAKPPNKKIVLDGYLSRLGKTAKGHLKWKKVWVVCYPGQVFIYTDKKDSVPVKRINLNQEMFVSPDVKSVSTKNKDMFETHDGTDEKEKGDKKINVPHMFLLSNLSDKFYFAAESNEQKELWVHMLANLIRESLKKQEGGMNILHAPHENRTAEQVAADQEARMEAYVKSQRKRTAAVGKLKKKMTEDEIVAKAVEEENRWAKEGKRYARQSIAVDLRTLEIQKAQRALEEQDELRRRMEEAERVAAQWKEKFEAKEKEFEEVEKEKKDVEALLESFRNQARERQEAKAKEQAAIEDKLRTLRRKSVRHVESGGDVSEYEMEIEALRTKLKALQSALNVDLDNLDWDGTLEDAEAKMKLLVPKLMSDNPEEQQKAQAEFDQWDQIVRNHADYLNREEQKWKTWKEENFEKNLNALNELKQLAPKEIVSGGVTADELMKITGCEKKTARRVLKNKIFNFFWMEKDKIAKIHIADLLNRYATQGLDIRETRAVYASLPDEFLLDADGRKKQFRDNIQNRLYELTEKEKQGRLTPNEELNNAYRKNDVKRKKPTIDKKNAPVRKKNNKMAQKAAMLQLMLEQGNSAGQGPDAAKNLKAAKPGQKKKLPKLPVGDPKYSTYFKMHKAGLPAGAIMNRIQKDGYDPSTWPDALAHHEKGGGATGSSSGGASKPSKKPETPKPEATATPSTAGILDALSNIVVGTDQNAIADAAKAKADEKKAKAAAKKAAKKKVTKKKSGRNYKVSGPLLGGNTDALVNIAGSGVDGVQLKGGAKGVQFDDYGSTKSQKRAMKLQGKVEGQLDEMIEVIKTHGAFDPAEGGVKTITFGELFTRYEKISDILVGLLFKAKKRGLIKYRGDMLFQGIHDGIKITLLSS